MEWVDENEPDPQQSNVNVNQPLQQGDVALVSRREGGVEFTSVLYIREHLVEHVQRRLDDFISSHTKRIFYVTGPPGCGKTCFLYLWARRLAVLEQKRALIVQFREKHSCFLWIREAGGHLRRMKKIIHPSKLGDTVEYILNKNEEEGTHFDLCIHDGVIDKLSLCSNMLGILNTATTNGVIRKVVHVTSLAFRLSTGGQLLGGPLSEIVQGSVDSWLERDYQNAVASEAFVSEMMANPSSPFSMDAHFLLGNSAPSIADDDAEDNESTSAIPNETLSEVVKAKYFYAGGSARFMFQCTLETLRSDLDSRMNIVQGSDWDSFTQRAVSSGTPSAVNTLMQQFGNICTPLSKYVLFSAYEKCKTALVKSVRAAASSSRNPALAGWAFELEQLEVIRLSYESTTENPLWATNGTGLSFRPISQAEFNGTDVTSGNVQDGTVIWCQKWNQGCFDVALYSKRTLITIQFTLQEVHSLKPLFVRKLRDALRKKKVCVDRCMHIGMREVGWNQLQFKRETLGAGRQMENDDAEFLIEVYHSPPMTNELKGRTECNLPSSTLLFKEEMWKFGTKRPRTGE